MAEGSVLDSRPRSTARRILDTFWGIGTLNFVAVEETTFELWATKVGTEAAFDILLLCVAKKWCYNQELWTQAWELGIPWERRKSWRHLTELARCYNDNLS